MLLGALLMIAGVPPPIAQHRDNQEHALIVVQTQVEERFIAEALRFADAESLTPVTLDEIDAFVVTERRKDLERCADVTCYSEIAGALDIKHVVRITPTEVPKRAVLTLYSLFPVPQQRKRKVVSGETPQEALLRSMADFRQKRQALAGLLEDIPCGFPWSKLRPVVGKPDMEEPYSEDYEYFDLVIFVRKDKVVAVKGEFGSGPHMLECNRPRPRWPSLWKTDWDKSSKERDKQRETSRKQWQAKWETRRKGGKTQLETRVEELLKRMRKDRETFEKEWKAKLKKWKTSPLRKNDRQRN